MGGRLEVAGLLRGRASAAGVNSGLAHAAERGHAAIFDLLKADPRVDAHGLNRALEQAAGSGHLALVRELLATPGINPAYENSAALRYATFENHYDVAALLLRQPGVDPRQAYYLRPDPLHQAQRAKAERLLQIATEFYANTLEQFQAAQRQQGQ